VRGYRLPSLPLENGDIAVRSGWKMAVARRGSEDIARVDARDAPLPVAPEVGLCGTAACLKTPVIVPDIATEPLWLYEEHRKLALKSGIRAAWSDRY